MIIYNYNAISGEYIGTGEAKESPREQGIFLIPANAVTAVPPTVGVDEVAVWNGAKWEVLPDFRGKKFWDKATREAHEIKEIGVTPDVDWTNVEPSDPDAEWNGSTWEVPFTVLVERKKTEIATARYNAEIAGATINGVSIKTDRETQAVLTAAYLQAYIDSGYSLNWKTGDGTFVSLPAEQIMAFGTAVRAHVQSCFDREAELLPLIEAATTEAELDAISW